jgi:lipoyl(octanoyl) transferase
MPHFRLLPIESLSGPMNMAADEVMLEAAADRAIASLRFYTWSEPTLSLGYFQPAAARLSDPLMSNLAWVRRPSGGGAILHHHELTYCLAVPAGSPWQGKESWVCRFHHLVSSMLHSFGITSREVVCGEEKKLGEFLCFLHQTPADLLIDSSKVVGSAQRKLRGALMQHGSIILQRSEYAPAVPGIRELGGERVIADDLAVRLAVAFENEAGWEIRRGEWTEEEKRRIDEVARDKYATMGWNEKR